MRTPGSPLVLEDRRQLAVQRSEEGYSREQVAEFLNVNPSSVRRWVASFRGPGAEGLAARPGPGRPPKLSFTQEKIGCRGLADNPTQPGCVTERGTAPALARLLEQEGGVHFNPEDLTTGLRQRGFRPQKPRRRARQGDDEASARGLEQDGPRLKTRRVGGTRTCG